MKIIGKVLFKLMELAPVFSLLIVFTITSCILPSAVNYTLIRWKIHSVESSARYNGYWNSDRVYVEDWNDARKEKYYQLIDQLEELISTNKIAELCNTYGTKETKLVRNVILFAGVTMWILSIGWMTTMMVSEIKYQKRRFERRKRKKNERQRLKRKA